MHSLMYQLKALRQQKDENTQFYGKLVDSSKEKEKDARQKAVNENLEKYKYYVNNI